MTRAQIIPFRLFLIAALAAITYLAVTRQEYPLVQEIYDKANHIVAFYALALLVDFSFPQKTFGFSKIIGLLSYGVLIEVVQGFLPGRTPSLLDLVADGVGIASYRFSQPLLKRVPLLGRRWTAQA
jgi:VanZ family protein